MSEARFCEQCGKSLVPLPSMHVQRECQDCGRTVHVADPGEGGQGIRVEKGDKFVIPAGAISLSLDLRKTTGRFSRTGVTWFVRHAVTEPLNRSVDDLGALLTDWENEGDSVLRASERLSHLNLDDEKDQEASIALVIDDADCLEYWAWKLIAHADQCAKHLQDGNASEATLAACRAQGARFMITYLRDLEEYVWTGYQHAQLIYGIAKATAQTPAEAEAIEALRPIFENLSEEVLHAWANSGADIGPRIGVTDVDERLLKALAEFHLNEFERNRGQRQLDREHRSRGWANSAALIAAGAGVATLVLGALRATGVL